MFVVEDDMLVIYPWLESIRFDTLLKILRRLDEVAVFDVVPMFRIKLFTKLSKKGLYDRIENYSNSVDPMDLIEKGDNFVIDKFDRYVSESLLRKRFVSERIYMDFTLTSS